MVTQSKFLDRISFVVAAAGTGSRAKLNYPKCLFKLDDREILLRILDAFPSKADINLITSPSGNKIIRELMDQNQRSVRYVLQDAPKGMGDAVLCLNKVNESLKENILLTWGDLPFLTKNSIKRLIRHHFTTASDFSFITYRSENAYTIVHRDEKGIVSEIIETREFGIKTLKAGERDIGVFLFKKKLIFDYLQKDLPNKFGKHTGEHGFLYVVKHLYDEGHIINTIETKNYREAISFNSLEDLT